MLRWLWIPLFLLSACASTRPGPARSSGAPPPAESEPASSSAPPPAESAPSSTSAPTAPPSATTEEPAPPLDDAPPPGPFLKAQVALARAHAASLASAVTLWQVQNGADSCPSFDALVRDGVVSPGTSGVDPWKHDYSVACSDSGVSVTSSGPDGRLGTSDDVVAGKP